MALRLPLRIAAGVVALAVAYLAFNFWEVWRAASRDDVRPAQAIVVLGAAQYDGRPSPVLRARLDHAADLYRRRVAPVVVVTGGRAEGDRYSEATAAADYLHTKDVPDGAILRETSGRSSWESLAASARILEQRGIHQVVLVSDPFHSKRIAEIAGEVGLDGRTSPTRTSPIRGASAFERMVSESVKVAVGRVIGFRRLMRLRPAASLVSLGPACRGGRPGC